MTDDSLGRASGSAAQPPSPNMLGMLAAGPLAALVFVISLLFGESDMAFTGPESMQTRLFIVSLIAAPLAYVYGSVRRRDLDEGGRAGAGSRIPLVARTLALALGLAVLVLLLVPVLSQAFSGYTFPRFWGAVTAAAYGFVVGYVAAGMGARAWVGDTVVVAAVVALVGILEAAAFSGSEEWWTTAISALGTQYSMSWRLFDLVCVTAGVMAILSVFSLRPVLLRAAERGDVADGTVVWFPRIMAAVAVLLCFVGLFPMDGNSLEFLLHNVGGIGFGVTMFFAMLLTGRAFPGLPREFVWYSWAFAALTALAVPLFWPLKTFSLAELEVVAFGLEGLWALLLFASLRDAELSG